MDYIFRELAISYQNREDLAHTPSIGGNDAGINHWMNAEHQGYGGYFYIHSINHRRSIAQIAFTDETEDTCLVDFHIPLVLLEDIEA